MTDKDIIKALECCTTNGASCKDCPAFVKVERSNCKKYFRGALALINRQQEEIERLNEKVDFVNDIDVIRKIIKAEAVKEFAERLIRDITINNTNDGYLDYAVDYNCLIEDIQDLVEEITEVKK